MTSLLLVFTVHVCLAQESAPTRSTLLSRHWEPSGYAAGGLFTSIAVHPQQPNIIYLTSDVSGVYRSDNYGTTWRSVSNGLGSLAIASLTIDPARPDRLWVGTALGLYRSDDEGETWSNVNRDIQCPVLTSYRAIAVSQDGDVVLVAGNELADEAFETRPDGGGATGRLYRSTDGGDSWHVVDSLPESYAEGPVYPSVMFDPYVSGQAFLLVSGRGILRSTDHGETWSPFNAGLPDDRSDFNWKHIDVSQNFLAATASTFQFDEESTLTKIYRSGKDTASWTSIGAEASSGLIAEDVGDLAVANPIVVAKTDENTLYLGSEQWPSLFFRSTDGGNRWQGTEVRDGDNYHLDVEHSPLHNWIDAFHSIISLAVDPTDLNRVYATSWFTAWRSEDAGQTWWEIPAGTQNTVCTDVLFAGETLLSSNMDTLIYRSEDFGESWSASFPTRAGTPKADRDALSHAWDLELGIEGDIYASVSSPNGPGIYRSDDNGVTWNHRSTGLEGVDDPYTNVFTETSLAADPLRPGTVYAGNPLREEGIYVTRDSGENWSRLPGQPGSGDSTEDVLVKCLEVDPANSQRIFAGLYWDGLWYSEDGGEHWSPSNEEGEPDLASHSVQEIVALADGMIFAAVDDGVYKSVDHGRTFERSFPALSNLGEDTIEYVTSLAFNPEDLDEMFAGTAKIFPVYYNVGSVWRSIDGGESWTEITGDLQMKRVHRLTFHKGVLYAATNGGNVYRLNLDNSSTPVADWKDHK